MVRLEWAEDEESMKRLFVIIVVAIMLACSFGYADTDKEIKFRNITWGINIDEVKQVLSDIDFWNDEKGYALAHWDDEQDYYFGREENGWLGWCFNSSNDPLKVAGYPVSMIYLYCAYGVDEKGSVLRDRESSEFYMASYLFDVIDTQGTYEDLKDKMTKLYGEGVETTEFGYGSYNAGNSEWKGYKSTIMTVEWNGANNTGVVLTGRWDDRDTGVNYGNRVILLYGKTDYDMKLTMIEKAVTQERLQAEIENRSADIDGL